jgi:23S rRNA (guanosine2251-2'-O)-methyltransferase
MQEILNLIMKYKQHIDDNKSELSYLILGNIVSKKLNTRTIYERNQSRITPSGFNETIVWLHNIRSMHNVGSVFRTADAFGIKEIILSGYTPIPPRPEITKTALGAEKSVKWSSFLTILDANLYLKELNYLLVGLEQTDSSILINNLPIQESTKICLISGNEITGIDDQIIPILDHIVEIPQYGKKHSLNVSIATGIALFSIHELYRMNES